MRQNQYRVALEVFEREEAVEREVDVDRRRRRPDVRCAIGLGRVVPAVNVHVGAATPFKDVSAVVTGIAEDGDVLDWCELGRNLRKPGVVGEVVEVAPLCHDLVVNMSVVVAFLIEAVDAVHERKVAVADAHVIAGDSCPEVVPHGARFVVYHCPHACDAEAVAFIPVDQVADHEFLNDYVEIARVVEGKLLVAKKPEVASPGQRLAACLAHRFTELTCMFNSNVLKREKAFAVGAVLVFPELPAESRPVFVRHRRSFAALRGAPRGIETEFRVEYSKRVNLKFARAFTFEDGISEKKSTPMGRADAETVEGV